MPMPANPVLEGDYQNGPNLNGPGYGEAASRTSAAIPHLIIWDEDNNIAYEFFGVTRPADPTLFPNNNDVEVAHTDGQWHAAQETVWNMNTDTFRTLGDTSADAAGLSILAGLVRPDEGLPRVHGPGREPSITPCGSTALPFRRCQRPIHLPGVARRQRFGRRDQAPLRGAAAARRIRRRSMI